MARGIKANENEPYSVFLLRREKATVVKKHKALTEQLKKLDAEIAAQLPKKSDDVEAE